MEISCDTFRVENDDVYKDSVKDVGGIDEALEEVYRMVSEIEC